MALGHKKGQLFGQTIGFDAIKFVPIDLLVGGLRLYFGKIFALVTGQ
jgi:hypothetical protein